MTETARATSSTFASAPMRRFLLTVFVLAACGSPDTPAEPEAPAPPTAPAPPETSDARPGQKEGTISVEGMDQPVALRLVREADFPIPFSTYVPEEMGYDTVASGEGSAARFSLGAEPREAVLSVFVPSGGVDDLDAWAREAAETMGEPSQLEPPAWAEAAYSFGGVDRMGAVLAGRHAGRPFYVLESLPLNMGDGLGPRAAAVQREWRWLDDGSGLTR